MGTARLTPALAGKMALKCLLFLFVAGKSKKNEKENQTRQRLLE